MKAAVSTVETTMQVNVVPFRTRSMPREVSLAVPTCSRCKQREICLSVGLEAEALVDLEQIVAAPRRVARGERLYRPRDRFGALYAIRLGSFKTVVLADDGSEQVAGYHMPGEILGADGIAAGLHDGEAIALEDAEVCAIPFDRLQKLARHQEIVQKNVHRTLAREIARERRIMMLLGTMNSEQRLAAFLIDLSDRYRARGYSSSEFVLRMTREEIGSYLGLKLETVSRMFTRFQREGLLQAQGRVVKLLDLATLSRLLEHSAWSERQTSPDGGHDHGSR